MAPAPFTDFAVPPTPYLVGLGLGSAVVIGGLYWLRPRVTQGTLFAMVPWVFAGAALHVFYQIGEIFQVQLYPATVEPLFAAPAVYVSTFVLAGSVWLLSAILGTATGDRDYSALFLGSTGTALAVVLFALLVWQGLDPAIGGFRIVLPAAGLVGTVLLAAGLYLLVGLWRPYVLSATGYAGGLVIYAHLLDGVTTAIGADLLGVGERSVIPARIMEFAADLPTAEYIGVGWLFVVVKALVAVLIVWLFADYVRERPQRGYLALGFVMLVGLGPAFNNLLLFFLGAP